MRNPRKKARTNHEKQDIGPEIIKGRLPHVRRRNSLDRKAEPSGKGRLVIGKGKKDGVD